jgi:hypothetical protein
MRPRCERPGAAPTRGLVLGTAFAVLTLGLLVSLTSQAAPAEKVTICHAAGQDDTTHFIELNLSYNGAFGQAGHFYEDGTHQAGHEDDILGPCEKKPDPPDDPKAV